MRGGTGTLPVDVRGATPGVLSSNAASAEDVGEAVEAAQTLTDDAGTTISAAEVLITSVDNIPTNKRNVYLVHQKRILNRHGIAYVL